jgi:transcriptional regulator with XRE-family HTH domain
MKNKLYTLLKEKKVNISDLSTQTGLSRTTLTALTKDDILLSKTKIGTLEIIAKALNVFVSEIISENFEAKIVKFIKVNQSDFNYLFSRSPDFNGESIIPYIYIVKIAIHTETTIKYLYLSLSTCYSRLSEVKDRWNKLDNHYRNLDCPDSFSINILDEIDFLILKKQNPILIEELSLSSSNELINEDNLLKYNLIPVILKALGPRLKEEYSSLNDEVLKYYKNDGIWIPDLITFEFETFDESADSDAVTLPNYEIYNPFLYGYFFSSKTLIQPKVFNNTILTGYSSRNYRK